MRSSAWAPSTAATRCSRCDVQIDKSRQYECITHIDDGRIGEAARCSRSAGRHAFDGPAIVNKNASREHLIGIGSVERYDATRDYQRHSPMDQPQTVASVY